VDDNPGQPESGDAFGRALLDLVDGAADPVIIERDDGFVSLDTFDYLAGLGEIDMWALDHTHGRVLDVGAGAGRASLVLQEHHRDVVALDVSPGAAEACRRRGVASVYAGSIEEAAADGLTASFDTALLLGNNLGLLGSAVTAGPYLNALGGLLRPDGIIVGTCLDVYQTDKPAHLGYHERNRQHDRMAGQLTLRVRYQQLATSWFDWLAMSTAELSALAEPAGWRIAELRAGISYAVVLTRA
jgi:SAM-dependent methyltransferase